ncbi:pur operon repressor [Secundilactobacillus odoratitofui DSM 19909 = JCM 15043]|uniref:Pur operon repressor n=2 Tax=Secundilactobacillus odoratitofui TaxID=480930 RepID=A0A0R1M006_9LACO|nr:pur operon repressor [Secundilactobacillus odoratitofui DSM 19909 = JCM 15043]
MTRYLLERPHRLVSLTFFSERYESAKSSISEDLTILKRTFKARGTGMLETVPGAAGGARFIPYVTQGEATQFVDEVIASLSEADRFLPGGYLYMSDLLGRPNVLRQIGRLIATQYLSDEVDAVMTVATKGIPIAQSISEYLNVPFVIARHDSQITEGSTVSVNYVSGSSSRIEKMALSKRSLAPGARVLIVDDFMKGGGTLGGMQSLVKEFDATVAGVAVFAEGAFEGERVVPNYTSLLRIHATNDHVDVTPGNFVEQIYTPDRVSLLKK